MSSIRTSGRNSWQPRQRNQWQRDNSGRFADAMRFRKHSIATLLFITATIIGAAVL